MSENKVIPKKRKSGKKKVIAISLAGVLAAGGAGGVFYYKQSSAAKMPEETRKVQSATAELGSISNTIVGTGNLGLSDAQSQTIPSGIEVEEVMVESGDQVTKGDTIAVVSKASVLKAVEETQEEIQNLDDQISECQEEDDTETIDASVDGRVKLIYGEAGEDVTDIMLENGSVLTLSLDGKMAVDIKAAGLEEGDTVTVTLPSGTQVTGTVQKVSGTTCTVTVTDNGTLYDDEVTVTDSNGKELGTGNLYIHEPLEITGTTGTVSEVNVSENESVTSGTELLTLENSASEAQYEQLLAQREAYSATLKKLLQLSKNQKITADISGTVQSVNVSAGSSDTSSNSSSGTSTGASTGNSGTVSASKMSYTVSSGKKTVSAMSYSSMNYVSMGMTDGNSYKITRLSAEDTYSAADTYIESAEIPENEEELQTAAVLTLKITTAGQSTSDTLSIAAPVTGNIPAGEISVADGSYTGAISWNPGDSSFLGNTVYQANVMLYAGAGYTFTGDSISGIDTGIVSGISVPADGSTLSFTITYPQTAESSEEKNDPENNSGNESDENQNNNSSDGFSDNNTSENGKDNSTDTGTGTNGQGNTVSGNQNTTTENQSASGNQSAAGSGSASGAGSSAGSTQSGTATASSGTASADETTGSDTADTTSSAYSTDVEAFTISSDKNMILAVSVDELDINSVEIGQEATIELDAIEDETFTGEVTSIGNTASASGGVAKYTVSLTLPKDDRMKQGMNASATITIDSRENVVTIPVNALQEEGSKVFVYTEQDDEGSLSGEKEVTTGLSDGTTVEITEGLEEGETVYYNKTGNTDSSSGSGGFSGGDFGGENGGPGGDMPSGGNGGLGGNGGQNGGSSQGGGPGGMPNM